MSSSFFRGSIMFSTGAEVPGERVIRREHKRPLFKGVVEMEQLHEELVTAYSYPKSHIGRNHSSSFSLLRNTTRNVGRSVNKKICTSLSAVILAHFLVRLGHIAISKRLKIRVFRQLQWISSRYRNIRYFSLFHTVSRLLSSASN